MSQNPFTLSSFANWLSKQDPNETFEPQSCTDCCLCRYFKDMGFDVASLGWPGFNASGRWFEIPMELRSLFFDVVMEEAEVSYEQIMEEVKIKEIGA